MITTKLKPTHETWTGEPCYEEIPYEANGKKYCIRCFRELNLVLSGDGEKEVGSNG